MTRLGKAVYEEGRAKASNLAPPKYPISRDPEPSPGRRHSPPATSSLGGHSGTLAQANAMSPGKGVVYLDRLGEPAVAVGELLGVDHVAGALKHDHVCVGHVAREPVAVLPRREHIG